MRVQGAVLHIGMTLDDFRGNTLVFDAVVRNLEIIGEAAKHLPG